MGGSSGDTDIIGKPAKTDTVTRLWETVRRALGRLVNHTAVSEVPARQLMPTAVLSPADVLAFGLPHPGKTETSWRAAASVMQSSLPSVQAGSDNCDMTAVPAIVSADAALRPELSGIFQLPVRPEACDSYTPADAAWRSSMPKVWTEQMQPAGGDVQPVPLTLSESLLVRWLSVIVPPLTVPRRGSQNREVLPLAGGRIRPGASVMTRVPILRMRRPVPAGQTFEDAFEAQRIRLAHVTKTDLSDVLLVGVFEQIPVAVVSRLAVVQEGAALELWLKPESLDPVIAPRMLTLVIGRQRSTGKMIQAVA